MLTLTAIGIFAGLFILSMALAGISHHVKALTPLWLLVYMLNKISVIAIPICIVVDIVRLIF